MSLPQKQGLYDPRNEHDSCGVGFVANIKGQKSHGIIGQGLQLLINLDHRGAVGADPLVGDGAGILIQIPDALLREWAKSTGVGLPEPGKYAVAMCFLPREAKARDIVIKQFEHFIKVEGQVLLGGDVLVAEEQHLPVQQRLAQRVAGGRIEGFREIDAGNLRPDGRRQRRQGEALEAQVAHQLVHGSVLRRSPAGRTVIAPRVAGKSELREGSPPSRAVIGSAVRSRLMPKHERFELRRQSDDLIYRFARAVDARGETAWLRQDLDVWIRRHHSLGWIALDEASQTCTGRPWDIAPQDQGDHPPEGVWVSRKGAKAYVYDLVYVCE